MQSIYTGLLCKYPEEFEWSEVVYYAAASLFPCAADKKKTIYVFLKSDGSCGRLIVIVVKCQ